MPLPVDHYISAAADSDWIRDFIAEWRLDRETGGWDFALSTRLRRQAETAPDSALALIVALACPATDDAERWALADELEWLLHVHGRDYWETLNSLCSQVPAFRAVMGNVWGDTLPKDLRHKVDMWRG